MCTIIQDASKTSVTLKKRKDRKKCFVRVRTDQTASGKTNNSSWSKAKAVITRK